MANDRPSPTGRDVGPCRARGRIGQPYGRAALPPRWRTSPNTGETAPDHRSERDPAALMHGFAPHSTHLHGGNRHEGRPTAHR